MLPSAQKQHTIYNLLEGVVGSTNAFFLLKLFKLQVVVVAFKVQ